ncbi:suppressor of RPS4-RLD 1 [Iris pallida]|uniref:Suppressor of RPS4-RLD 1 n=1 Tax=Iris pallida TaxID=29817 RepID=A0AAX6HMW1_IRIPA|nr:suppressor of RPS4-RLD 1 [Iris pallida]
MASTKERAELAKLCGSRNWSKAIRLLDSFLSSSASTKDLCNRAFCYSQLELHKHVIKDCDRALELDRGLLQAYILKGNALSALGRKEAALLVLEQGHENAVHDSTNLKQLLELEELLASAKQNKVVFSEDHAIDSSNRKKSTSDTKAIACDDHLTDSSSSSTLTTDTEFETQNRSDDTSETFVRPYDTTTMCSISKGSVKNNRKLFVTKSISLDLQLSRGIAQVNEGKYDNAISIFDQILRENPTYPEALIGRGTAHAFQRELENAIADFTKAIESNRSSGEAWKRRGQARAALGESVEAIQDLTKALEFEPNSSDILHERGIVNFKFKDYAAAVDDLSACVLRDKKNKSAYTYLGLALAAIGEYKRAEEAHLKSIQLDQNFLEGWGHLAQFYLDLASSEKALNCLQQQLQVDGRFAKAYHLRGLLHHGMGLHRTAIKDFSLGLSIESSNIDCLYLRGSCYHAVGEYGDAVKDYDAVLDLELDSVDKFVLQCSAFYQKEIALYSASKFNSEFCWFDIDRDVDPLFKEYWCKKLHPKYVCERVFRQPPLRDSLKKGRLRKQEFAVTKQKTVLLQVADSIGQKIQYSCPGFLPNIRQYRMAGLAAIEIAQKVIKAWRSMRSTNRNGKKARKKENLSMLSQNRGGSCCTTSSSECSTSYSFSDHKYTSGRFLCWQDIYNIAVKWRQISEPCDSVVWINKLSEEFNSGFGSHTPMLLGQAKVVRYFPYYQRTIDLAKSIMKETKYANNSEDNIIELCDADKLAKIKQATSCNDLYSIIGENFWVATNCDSTAFEGVAAFARKRLEGTRITVQKMDKRGFDFAIRTPCTPSRWNDYEAEMAVAWEALCNAYCGEAYGSSDLSMLENVKDSILRMTYYWYNFMPLSRGSSAVGYTVLLGLFLAANMEVTRNIPSGIQVDWEAILSSSPDTFSAAMKSWLYPSLRISMAWKDHPDVASTFSTTGSIVAALSSYNT